MKEIDDDQIKMEIDAISGRIDSIIKNVEKIVPANKETPSPDTPEEKPAPPA